MKFFTALLLTLSVGTIGAGPLSVPSPRDQAKNLVDELRHTTLDSIARAGLESARLSWQPWSDSYWPYYQGLAAIRFADPRFPAAMDWRVNASYLLRTLGQGPVWMLSPAEKYDLLVGDRGFTLTRTMIRLGGNLYAGPGTPAEWMGICNGWAAASISEPRPRHSVTALAADGVTLIYFSPSDIKGLTTLLWARGNFAQRFVGTRCRRSRDCIDTNPATWHLSVVNQLGLSRRSFIMDIDYGSEVWNHPVLAYQTRYFQPATGLPASNWNEARVDRKSYPNDPYRRFRARDTRFIVGVEMDVQYMVEDFPRPDPLDQESLDKIDTLTLRYDLELDAQGFVIGGEWHQEDHPDFLWRPVPGALARSSGDSRIDWADGADWTGQSPLPPTWQKVAIRTSTTGTPLRAIVERLLTLANQ